MGGGCWRVRLLAVDAHFILIRVPTQILFKIPCVFPVQLEIFPVPNLEIYNNFIPEADFFENFTENIAISCILRIKEFTT